MASTPPVRPQQNPAAPRGQVVLASTLASVVSTFAWYDLFLYTAASALVFPTVFFPSDDRASGVFVSFAVYAVGFAARPLGAALFGHLGDRIGRRAALLATILLLVPATALMPALPTHSSAGIWGGVLLTILRLAQGIAIGGEWGTSTLLAMEWGSNRQRGLVASWPQAGMFAGLALGIGALLGARSLAGGAFLSWGWRLPFIVSLLLIVPAVAIRLWVGETPTYRRLFDERRIEPQPVAEAFSRSFKEIVLSALLRVPEAAPFFVFTTFVLTYDSAHATLGADGVILAVAGSAALAVVMTPLAGRLSDLLGRRRTYLAGVIATGVFAFPYFLLLDTRVPVLAGLAIGLSLVLIAVMVGPQAALIAESFTGRYRCSGASLGYQLGFALAGATAPLAVMALGGWAAIAGYLVACAAIGAGATILMPGRAAADHTREYESTAGGSMRASGGSLPARG